MGNRSITAWTLARGRRKFFAQWQTSSLTQLVDVEKDPTMLEVADSTLGAPTPSGERSNFAEVSTWMLGFAAQNPAGTTSSSEVFCGLVRQGGPQSHADPHGAHIAIGYDYLRRSILVTRNFQAFILLAAELPKHDMADRQTLLEQARSTLFQTLAPNSDPAVKATLIYGPPRLPEPDLFTVTAAKGAVQWAIAHELGHLLSSNRLIWREGNEHLRAAGHTGPRTASNKHLREYGSDRLGLQHLLGSSEYRNDPASALTGSLMGTLAIIWHGWSLDMSAPSPTHPSPSARYQYLYCAWLSALHARAADNQTDQIPDPAGLADFAIALLFERWSAGEYSRHRSGVEGFQRDAEFYRSLIYDATNRLAGPTRLHVFMPDGSTVRSFTHPWDTYGR